MPNRYRIKHNRIYDSEADRLLTDWEAVDELNQKHSNLENLYDVVSRSTDDLRELIRCLDEAYAFMVTTEPPSS